jgi:hypothetical protein
MYVAKTKTKNKYFQLLLLPVSGNVSIVAVVAT